MVSFFKRVYIPACLVALAYGAPPRDLALSAGETILDSSVGSPTTHILPGPSETVPPASDDPNYPAYPPDVPGPAQPIRGNLGATILGPQNIPIQQQNPDHLAPPTTDNGDVCVYSTLWLFTPDVCLFLLFRPNAKWPYALSNNHIYPGGWARQQNGEPSRAMLVRFNLTVAPQVGVMPIATSATH